MAPAGASYHHRRRGAPGQPQSSLKCYLVCLFGQNQSPIIQDSLHQRFSTPHSSEPPEKTFIKTDAGLPSQVLIELVWGQAQHHPQRTQTIRRSSSKINSKLSLNRRAKKGRQDHLVTSRSLPVCTSPVALGESLMSLNIRFCL